MSWDSDGGSSKLSAIEDTHIRGHGGAWAHVVLVARHVGRFTKIKSRGYVLTQRKEARCVDGAIP